MAEDDPQRPARDPHGAAIRAREATRWVPLPVAGASLVEVERREMADLRLA